MLSPPHPPQGSTLWPAFCRLADSRKVRPRPFWPRRCRRGASVTPWPLMTGVVWWVKLWCQNCSKGQGSQGHVPEGWYEHIDHVRYWTMNVDFLTFLLVFFANYNVSQKTFMLVVIPSFHLISNYSAFHLHTSITSSIPTRIQPHSSSAAGATSHGNWIAAPDSVCRKKKRTLEHGKEILFKMVLPICSAVLVYLGKTC